MVWRYVDIKKTEYSFSNNNSFYIFIFCTFYFFWFCWWSAVFCSIYVLPFVAFGISVQWNIMEFWIRQWDKLWETSVYFLLPRDEISEFLLLHIVSLDLTDSKMPSRIYLSFYSIYVFLDKTVTSPIQSHWCGWQLFSENPCIIFILKSMHYSSNIT